ncbi:hypothetical protein COHA_000366 [Chlorella ohadii]|uniref:Glutamine amidotransferase type-2 domain-containing protein n=1 Tax=Chlorella ohadii TaxID=2649997 RepID=A0AAD5E153_9CHLO|nr:hypothetical protein COHA_000366 [Chlorella ohadii]
MEVPIPRQAEPAPALAAGSFVVWAPPARGLKGLLSFGRGTDGGERLKALASAAAALAAAGALPPAGFSAPASYSLAGGACLLVRYGLAQAAGLGLSHATPNVHYEPATRTACVFTGHLQNLDELVDRHSGETFGEGPTSPSSVLAGRGDPRQLAAETLLHMYIKERQAGGDLLLLLSELQGQFSFVLFDGEKRQVFAARDSSGSEPLYYALDEDGAVSLSNDQPPVPTADEGRVQWCELPPGHFISGRSPKVQQFALTPQQLSIRETYEREMDEDISPRAFAVLVEAQEEEMRRSLSDEMRRSRSLSPDRGHAAVY